MSGRENQPIGDRDLKPEIVFRRRVHPRRARRVAELLLEILDTAGTPGDKAG